MKKTNKLILAIILLVIGCTILTVVYIRNAKYEIKTFSCAEYSSQINTLAVCHIIEPVENAEGAVINAKMLWDRTFGYVSGKYYDPNPGKNVAVYYDQKENCWLITGTPPKEDEDMDYFYYMPYVIICDTGEAFVWME